MKFNVLRLSIFNTLPSGQSAMSERHPRLPQSQVLAYAVWCYRQDETKRTPLPGKALQSEAESANTLVQHSVLPASVSGHAVGSAELGGRDQQRLGPTVPFPRNVPLQGRTRVWALFSLAGPALAVFPSSVLVFVRRQRGLFRVLKSYTQFKPEEGYCQAQGPVAAVLLMNMPAEVTGKKAALVRVHPDAGCVCDLAGGLLVPGADQRTVPAWILQPSSGEVSNCDIISIKWAKFHTK